MSEDKPKIEIINEPTQLHEGVWSVRVKFNYPNGKISVYGFTIHAYDEETFWNALKKLYNEYKPYIPDDALKSKLVSKTTLDWK